MVCVGAAVAQTVCTTGHLEPGLVLVGVGASGRMDYGMRYYGQIKLIRETRHVCLGEHLGRKVLRL